MQKGFFLVYNYDVAPPPHHLLQSEFVDVSKQAFELYSGLVLLKTFLTVDVCFLSFFTLVLKGVWQYGFTFWVTLGCSARTYFGKMRKPVEWGPTSGW